MANTQRTRGAWPVDAPLRMTPYTAGGTVYPGDLLITDSTGRVVAGAASGALIGVAAHKATAGNEVLVYDHPDQKFGIQANGVTPSATTDLLLNYDFVASAANTTYNRSNHVLNTSSGNTTATLPLKLIGYERRPDNALAGNTVDCVVVINNHQLKGGTGTAGT